MLMLEAVPADLAARIAREGHVPVVGFGSGPEVDGQILLAHDLLGLFNAFTGRFAKRYLNLSDDGRAAMTRFVVEVREGAFPGPEHYERLRPEVAKQIGGTSAPPARSGGSYT